MSYYDIIDISEEIVITKTRKQKEWNICHCWCYFFK